METRKKGLFGFKKSENLSWKVILKAIPDKQLEGSFVDLLSGKLGASMEDTLKITHSLPIVLFSELSSHEAEKIKLFFNEMGVRTAISNEPDELRGLGVVVWPKKITAVDLGDVENEIPLPPSFSSSQVAHAMPPKQSDPVFSSRPVVPLKPKPDAPPPVLSPVPSTPVSENGTGDEKLIGELEKMRTDLRTHLERLEKLIRSLKTPVPPMPGLKSDPPLPPRVR